MTESAGATDRSEAGSRIVVGVDGSEKSSAALKWALREAGLRHSSIVLVHGWLNSSVGLDQTGYAIAAFEQAGETVLAEAVAAAHAQARELDITSMLSPSTAAQAIIDLSEDADLVVLGSRGHGGFAGLLLGSVSTAVVHHAHCPVVIVR